MKEQIANDILKAGTGFMLTPFEAIKKLEKFGYTDNLVACYDHFECDNGTISIYPQDFTVDRVMRFENSSDPDDQSVLYAVSSPQQNIYGIYLESFGTYHEDLSPEMRNQLKETNSPDVSASSLNQ